MARGDGIHRTNARNMRLTAAKIGNVQQHNEREKESYSVLLIQYFLVATHKDSCNHQR